MMVTSTPPSIDWYIFNVDGRIERESGTLANHTVVLLGNCRVLGSWDRIDTCDGEGTEPYGPFVTTTLTSEAGEFSLRASVCGSGYPSCDTLAVGVVYPDTIIVGAPFAFNIVKPTEIEKTGKTQGESGFICTCDNEYTYVDGYIYDYPSITVTVP